MRRQRPVDQSPALPSTLREEIYDLLDQPERWLSTPNDWFGGRKPADLIGTEDEELLHGWVIGVKHGTMS